MTDGEPTYVRVSYHLDGNRTFWTRADSHTVSERGMLEAMNIETAQRNVLSPAVEWKITVGVELPHKVKNNEQPLGDGNA